MDSQALEVPVQSLLTPRQQRHGRWVKAKKAAHIMGVRKQREKGGARDADPLTSTVPPGSNHVPKT